MIPGSASPFFLGASKATGGGAAGYQIERSLRFNSSDSAYLSRTPGTASNRKTWTWAGWVKRSALGASQYIFESRTGSSDTTIMNLSFNASDQLQVVNYSYFPLISTPVYRDASAWYHIVWSLDTTQATASNRMKLYVNGIEVTTFGTDSRSTLTQNSDQAINQAAIHYIGGQTYLSGYLADIHFIDGQALTPSSFTEVSATTGQLIPKAYSGSFGTNGFWLKFSDNSAATAATLGKDYSGNSNNWTPNNLSVTPVVYTNQTVLTGSIYPGAGGISKIFDGTTATCGPDNGSFVTFTPSSPISISSSLRVRANVSNGSVDANFKINGVARSTVSLGFPTSGSIVNAAATWVTITSPPSSLTSLTFGWTNSWMAVSGIEIDGVVLVDGSPSIIDSLVDTPTSYGTDTGVGGEVRGNYCVINPLTGVAAGRTVSNGNLEQLALVESVNSTRGTIGVKSGKWYWEVTVNVTSGGGVSPRIGICRASAPDGYSSGLGADEWCLFMTEYNPYGGTGGHNGGFVGSYAPIYPNDIGMFALDMDNAKIYFGKNGTWLNSGNPVSGVGAFFSDVTGEIFPMINTGYFTSVSCNFGQRAFAYTAPSGFKALCDTNLGAPVVAKPNTVMDVKLYTGNGAANTITGLAFSPDLVWIKARSAGYWHELFDVVRGVSRRLFSNDTAAEDFRSGQGLTAFNADGFSLTYVDGNDNGNNGNGSSFVAWAWDAGTSTVSNTAGSITSQVRANASAGFSVVTFTAQSSGSGTIGHGLGVTPEFVIVKSRAGAYSWIVWHKSLTSAAYSLILNTTAAQSNGIDAWNSTLPTSSVFSLGSGYAGASNSVAYCFAPVVGYSSFGSYTGNGSADGPFVYTGFRPRWVMIKRSSGGANGWHIADAARSPDNLVNEYLYANTSDSEFTNGSLDFLSNGFKLKADAQTTNNSGVTYVYACFAEAPFQYARAR